jgi:hypothetical protein
MKGNEMTKAEIRELKRIHKTVRVLAEKLEFVPVSETHFVGSAGFDSVAYNDEFVLFSNGREIEWVAMNGHYFGRFEI